MEEQEDVPLEGVASLRRGTNEDLPKLSLMQPEEVLVRVGRRRSNYGADSVRMETISPMDTAIYSSEANMIQLYQTFMDLYLPRVYKHDALRSIWAAAPTSPALYAAIKSVSLMLIHRASNDERLLHAAKPEYAKALRHTSQELRRKEIDKFAIVGMSHMLSICELFHGLSIDASPTSVPHVHWMIAFIESYRTEPPGADVRKLLASGIRWFATWGVLVSRKSIGGFELRPWDGSDTTADSIVTRIGDLTLATVAVVEDCDKLCEQDDPEPSRILVALNKTTWLEGEIHKWMTGYYKLAPSTRVLYWTTQASTFPAISREHSASKIFKHVYDFRSMLTSTAHVSYWICLFMLVESRISISKKFYSQIAEDIDKDYVNLVQLQSLSSGYSDSICMSMPSMAKPENGLAGPTVATRPLALLIKHYKDRRDWQKLSWCVQCAIDLGICNSKLSDMQMPDAS